MYTKFHQNRRGKGFNLLGDLTWNDSQPKFFEPVLIDLIKLFSWLYRNAVEVL